jgi:hypothetical protein
VSIINRFYGAAVSTLDFESRNPGSNPGRTFSFVFFEYLHHFVFSYHFPHSAFFLLVPIGSIEIKWDGVVAEMVDGNT